MPSSLRPSSSAAVHRTTRARAAAPARSRAKLTFADLTATGHVTVFMGYAASDGHDVDVTAQASADLARLPACSLTFDDLAVLNSATGPK
ncbi:MAG TPA: hypothetical protein VIK01_10255 [Polyangiaceae bacterium]